MDVSLNSAHNVAASSTLTPPGVLRLMSNFARKGFPLRTLQNFAHLSFDYNAPSSGSITIELLKDYNSKRSVAGIIQVPHHMDKLQAYLTEKGVSCINAKETSSLDTSCSPSEQGSSVSVEVATPPQKSVEPNLLQSSPSRVIRVSFSTSKDDVRVFDPNSIIAPDLELEPMSVFNIVELFCCCLFGLSDGNEEKKPLL